MIRAVLSNPSHPEYGVATIPFPIPHDQYAHCMELLEALEIGDAVKADCKVQAIDSFYSVFKRTEMLTVNVEELNYLAKRLDSFDTGEAAQFQAMAHKLELFELKDLINLTFCCQQATVITDFSDISTVGRNHYMNLHGGSARVDELEALDGVETARQLIENGNGAVTPYGVVYDNGMKLEQVYDGRFFPCYYYEPNAITVAVTSKSKPEDTEHITWLFLPMVQEEIERALLRGGITDSEDVRLRLEDSQLPNEADVLLDMEYETLSDLNELAGATDGLSKADMWSRSLHWNRNPRPNPQPRQIGKRPSMRPTPTRPRSREKARDTAIVRQSKNSHHTKNSRRTPLEHGGCFQVCLQDKVPLHSAGFGYNMEITERRRDFHAILPRATQQGDPGSGSYLELLSAALPYGAPRISGRGQQRCLRLSAGQRGRPDSAGHRPAGDHLSGGGFDPPDGL